MATTPSSSGPEFAAMLRKVLFIGVIVAFGLVVLGSLGSVAQLIYIKMEHRGQTDDQGDK